jgi:hypothetical protein
VNLPLEATVMPIPVICPSCKAKLKAPERAVGLTLDCPACKEPVLVTMQARPPAAKPAAAPPTPANPKTSAKRKPASAADPTGSAPTVARAPETEVQQPRIPAEVEIIEDVEIVPLPAAPMEITDFLDDGAMEITDFME